MARQGTSNPQSPVYTTETGSVEVSFTNLGFHGADREPTQQTGWRDCGNGMRELVHWTHHQWVSDTEVNSARVQARTFK